ncbi:Disrupted in renal carcinoma protein 2 [Chionoecetes opilio]|uniref:Disrupted in renal carcinoma protein 2 n=1 Tax=Chionoecetes opilio TaxID=41210 RepID=A0A8J4Z3B6_CHIOP|nr:Disrupted in renal carcinoma protein 2 [Chionoecetes opilio]
MCHMCALLVGTAGTLVMAAPPMIAAVWFPPNERTTATAFIQMSNQLGNAGSYLEPLLVREPSDPHPGPEEVTEIRSDIRRLMYIWAGVGVATMVTVLVYFPSKPPSPPSLTSHIERLGFIDSMKIIVRNRDLLLVTLSYGLAIGVPSAWASVLNYSLYELGMTQKEAMGVGLFSVLAASLATLVMGRLTDMVYGHIKLSLIVCLAFTLLFYYWFFLLTWGAVPVTTWQIYAAVIGGLAFTNTTPPLFFELAVETAYPASEVVVGGVITATNNLIGLCFLFLFLVPFSSK